MSVYLPPPPGTVADRLMSTLAAPGTWTSLAEHRARFAPPPAASRGPDHALIDEIERAGLHGRGGAGFPTAVKLHGVAAGRRRPVVLANGAEGEPASSKDALLLSRAPHLVLDGAFIAAAALGADEVIVGVKVGAGHARRSLDRALAERHSAEPWTPHVRVFDVPPRYLAGEERALVSLVNGGPAIPPQGRWRPFERGVSGRPTLVQNVETLGHLALIRGMGADRFREVGHPEAPGTMLSTVGGAVPRPGVYEVETGRPVMSLIREAGGAPEDVGAALVGGYSGAWLSGEQVARATLDPQGMAAVDGVMGCGVVVVLPPRSCGVRETAGVLRWMADQTAGQCGPCVYGLAAIADAAADLDRGVAGRDVVATLQRWGGDVTGRGACRYPDGAVRFLRSALRTFAADVRAHASGRPCSGADRPRILPLPDVGWAA